MSDEHEYMRAVEDRAERLRAKAQARLMKGVVIPTGRTWWQKLFRYRIRIIIERSW